jgi:hypothetical protein
MAGVRLAAGVTSITWSPWSVALLCRYLFLSPSLRRRPAPVRSVASCRARMMWPVERPADARLSFDRAADMYDEVRPSYPGAIFDELFRMLPPGPADRGGGPRYRPSDERPARSWCIRPRGRDRCRYGRTVASQPSPSTGCESALVTSSGCPSSGSADAVFSATAYHWIRPPAQTDRPARILRPAGVLAIVDLIQVSCPSDQGFFAAAQPIYERYGQGHSGPACPDPHSSRAPPMRAVIEVRQPVPQRRRPAVRLGSELRRRAVPEADALVLRHADDGRAQPDRLLGELESFIEGEFGGRITRPTRRHADHGCPRPAMTTIDR